MQRSTLTRFFVAGGLGMLLGGATGFGLGVLLAPEAGQKTRRRLVYQLERISWRAADLRDRITESRSDSEARRSADELVADAQTQAQRIRDDIDDLLGEIRRHADEESSSAP